MGLFPETPAELEEHRIHMDERDAAVERLAKAMRAFGLEPIPKEKMKEYTRWCDHTCPMCNKEPNPFIGAFSMGDQYYDYLDLTRVVEALANRALGDNPELCKEDKSDEWQEAWQKKWEEQIEIFQKSSVCERCKAATPERIAWESEYVAVCNKCNKVLRQEHYEAKERERREV